MQSCDPSMLRSQITSKMGTIDVLLKDIRGSYAPSRDPFADEADITDRLKRAVARLSSSDQTIILLYAEDRSMRKVAKRFKVSVAYIHKEIERIRKEIKSKL